MSQRLQIRRLRIETQTIDGLYGVDIPFDVGLNVIHADNTLGKSACFQAMVYGLGLEGVLGPSRNVPLKSALTRRLRKADKSEATVVESKIYLELRNSQDRYITIRRSSNEDSKDLVSVWEGYRLDGGLEDRKFKDYFVRMEGAYVRERGFHHYLTEFLDLELPQVLKHDGSHCPLYLEAIFSVNYVEQTRGWGGIQNVLPTYLGIQNLAQRVIEFTLALDVQGLRKKHEEAEARLGELEDLWSADVTKIEELASLVAGRVVDLPQAPRKNVDFHHLCEITIQQDTKEMTIDAALQEAQKDLDELHEHEIPMVNESAEIMTKELEEKVAQLRDLDEATKRLIEDLDTTEQYVQSIKIRKDSLRESLRKYKDVKRLVDIGSEEKFRFIERVCPTCGQSIDDSLLPHVHDHEVLGVEDNIVYLEKQIKILNTLLLSEEKRRKQKETVLSKARQDLVDLRSSIRAIKDSLISANNAPSKEAIRKEIALESKVETLTTVRSKALEIREDFREIGEEWETVCSSLSALPRGDLSSSDHSKLRKLEESFKSLLNQFEYRSTRIDEFGISQRTYKPAIENVELGSEASASDNIRMIWAYLYSLMIVARSTDFSTNHLGLLLLDEPRQQEARDVNFREFIRVTASSDDFDQQVIIGTSEKFTELQVAIEGLSINLRHFENDLIAPLEPLST